MSFIKRITRGNYYRRIFSDHKEDIAQLMAVLEDEVSRRTLKYLLASYTTHWHLPEYYYIKAEATPCTEHHFVTDDAYDVKGTINPYFLEEIFDLSKTHVLLDGGAYIGDTIETAQKHIPNLQLVYAFEPNKMTFEKLMHNARIKTLNIKYFNQGLGKKEGRYQFKNDDAGSRISDDGCEVIEVLSAGKFVSSLDKDVLPDFIKLDIEGAETDVLDSLEMFITEYQPDMAVSIYHQLEDLWTIPLMLKRICPDYRIYIRHQSNYFTETICYATTFKNAKS